MITTMTYKNSDNEDGDKYDDDHDDDEHDNNNNNNNDNAPFSKTHTLLTYIKNA